jgi:hypothetical protein
MLSDDLLAHVRDVKRTSFTIDVSRPNMVIDNVIFLHDAVVASEQLLIEAVDAIELRPQNLFDARLRNYYRSHLDEERDHIKWVRDDLKSVGVVPGKLPNKWAMGMAGSQYYLLKHTHPAALLGYMAVLEGDPTPVEAIESLEHVYGKKLLRFARFHAAKDLEHRKELFEIIDDAPDSLVGLIAYSTASTLDYMITAARTWGVPEKVTPFEGASDG